MKILGAILAPILDFLGKALGVLFIFKAGKDKQKQDELEERAEKDEQLSRIKRDTESDVVDRLRKGGF